MDASLVLMKRLILFFVLIPVLSPGQNLTYTPSFVIPQQLKVNSDWEESSEKPKPINYNTIGYLMPFEMKDLVIGGTSAVYKRFGTFLSYKVGIRNWRMPDGEAGDFTYDNVKRGNQLATLTGRSQKATTFMLSGGLVFCIWKKMPIYVGAGGTRYRVFFEYLDQIDNKLKWNVNPYETKFYLNYSAGFIIPLFGRVIMNVGYDHNPQSLFIGLGIRGKAVYDDIDEW